MPTRADAKTLTADEERPGKALTPELVLVCPELGEAAVERADVREEHQSEELTPELVLVCPELAPRTPRAPAHPAGAPAPSVHGRGSRTPIRPAERERRRRRSLLAALAHLGGPRVEGPRVARTLVFVVLFFAGAALSAGAGDKVATLLETDDGATATATTSTSESSTAETTTVLDDQEEAATDTGPTTTAEDESPSASGDEDRERDDDGPAADDETDDVAVDEAIEAEKSEANESADEPAADASADEPAADAIAPDQAAVGTETAPAKTASAETVPGADAGAVASAPAKKAKPRKLRAAAPAAGQAESDEATPLPPSTFASPVFGSSLGPLPDPTPPGLRLKPRFARLLAETSARAGVDWALLLGVLRARDGDDDGPIHGNARTVRALAKRIAGLGKRGRSTGGLRSLAGGDAVAEKALALRDYNRAVGLDALISGFEAAKPVLVARVLRDPRIELAPAGRSDVAAGRVDVRVLVTMLYLAQTHDAVAVSSLVSGHRLYARPGVVSAHVYGLALDVSALDGRPIAGNQEPGGLAEKAVRQVLLLPAEVAPVQVISLFNLGGASFALADHWDHIHVGFGHSSVADIAAEAIGPTDGDLVELWKEAGARYDIPWQVLGAINKLESDFGRNTGPSSAGAIGWMQFMPTTWMRWGVDADGDGVANPWDAEDAVHSAARYLAGAGAHDDLPRAIFAYNHAQWYVNDVLETAHAFGAG